MIRHGVCATEGKNESRRERIIEKNEVVSTRSRNGYGLDMRVRGVGE